MSQHHGARRKAALAEAVKKTTGGARIRAGRVKLDLPPLIDNGNVVPLSVEVESPMTEADHVKAIHVFTERNPQPYVLSAYLGPRAGRARIAMLTPGQTARLRLWRRAPGEDDGQEHNVRIEVIQRPQEAGAMRSS